jgi:uncharacterized membrane protein (UPF0127 family)
MHLSSRTYLVIAFLALCLCGGWYVLSRSTSQEVSLSFPDNAFHYEIVSTPAEQERGLGGRKEIPDNYGMLFVFASKDRYGFWMKDMLTPIDIVWLHDDGTIMKIDAQVDPATYPTAYYPPEPVKYVLETRAGYAARHDWKIGTAITLPGPYKEK